MLTVEMVSRVLFDVWDPIDINTLVTVKDEYDDVAPKILALLLTGVSRDAIAAALDRIVKLEIGLQPQNEQSQAFLRERNKAAAEALTLLRDGRAGRAQRP